jgi:hypothetical protein
MSRLSPPNRPAITAVVAGTLLLLSAGLTAEQSFFKRIVGKDTNVKYQTFKDPTGRFEIEFPEKDWKRLPSGGSSLAVFARNDGPTLIIERVTLDGPLTAKEMEGMSAVELGNLKDSQPKATDFKSDMMDSKAGRGVIIRYSREGTGPETVLQYTIAVGVDLFRINGVIPDKQLTKSEPIIMYMIQSFRAPAASTSK